MKALDFVTTGLQHATQTLYSVRDLYEKRDWKSAGAMLLDVVNAFLAIEDKVKVIGLADAKRPQFIKVDYRQRKRR